MFKFPKTPCKILKIIQIPISNLHTKNPFSNPAIQFVLEQANEFQEPTEPVQPKPTQEPIKQIFHPWPEWVELMDKLLKSGYFEGIGNPFANNAEMGPKYANHIRTACLNFSRDRFDLIRYLSRQDIGAIAGYGCPSIDRKVVNSAKRLRASLGIEEGNVCSSCIMRGSCERAYVRAREDQGGRTVDVMRLLLTYGLDPNTDPVENKPSLNRRVKESTRKLLKEILSFSSEELNCETPKSAYPRNPSVQGDQQEEGQVKDPIKDGDWICPKCNFSNFSRNVKCLQCNGLFHERLSKLRKEQDHLPLKKGDWICDKCHFMNFAKNTRCLQCKEKPPKRQLNPGEWECESCNYINFKKNVVCLKCDHRRPKASRGASSQSPKQSRSISRTRPYFGQLNQNTDDDVDEWEFVESDNADHVSSTSENQVSRFVDFPVLGGNSELSRDEKKQEKWKMEMGVKSRITAKESDNADEFKSSFTRDSKYLQYTDDEEMAEWFGHKNTQKAGMYQNPETVALKD